MTRWRRGIADDPNEGPQIGSPGPREAALEPARTVPDQVFVLRNGMDEVWKAVVNGRVVPAEFNSRGAAEAAIPVERFRDAKRKSKERGAR